MSIVFLTSNSHHQYLDKTTSKYFKILPIKSWIGIFKLYILITVNTVLPKAVEPKKKKSQWWEKLKLSINIYLNTMQTFIKIKSTTITSRNLHRSSTFDQTLSKDWNFPLLPWQCPSKFNYLCAVGKVAW